MCNMLLVAAGSVQRGPTKVIASHAVVAVLRRGIFWKANGQRRLYSIFDSIQKDSPAPATREEKKRKPNASLFNILHCKSKARHDIGVSRARAQNTSIFDSLHKEKVNVAVGSLTEGKIEAARNRLSFIEIQEEVQAVNQMAANLEPRSPFSSDTASTMYDDKIYGKELFSRTKVLMNGLKDAVERGDINPAGKDGGTVSAILGNILSFYSASHHKNENQSAFKECQTALSFLDQWNLDRLEPHYQYSVLAAVHEQKWQEASSLFLQQIDRNISGFCPVSISVSSPVGLYAIARAAQENRTSPVELVFNAVTSLSEISPTEQEEHILAAGTALGLAGEYEGLVSYLDSSINVSSMGQALVAATMHACILCHRHDKALEVFRTLVDGKLPVLSEFYLGGEEHQITPLCRDLAMRACENSMYEGISTLAIDLLRQAVQAELTVSAGALHGVLSACERDNNWKDAVDTFFQCLSDTNKLWLVSGCSLIIPTVEDLLEDDNLDVAMTDRGKIVSLVMRTCMAANQSGVSLLCLILADKSPSGSLFFSQTRMVQDFVDFYGPIEQTLLPFIMDVGNSDEVLSTAMVALSGVACPEQGRNLFRAIKESSGGTADLPDSESIDQYLETQYEPSSSGKQRLWYSTHRHIHRICASLEAIRIKGEMLGSDQLQVISSAFTSALRSSAIAGQPAAGILLGEYIQSELSRQSAASSEGHSLSLWPSKSNADYGLILDDSLLAEKMKALQAAGQSSVALSLFESAVVDDQAPSEWPQSCNVAIDLFVENDEHERAVQLLPELVKSTNNTDCFVAAATACAKVGRWQEVANVYHMASEKGCLSTKLAVLALKAVVETNIPGRLQVLRSVVHDAGQAGGQTPATWLEQNYWQLKSRLGFSHTRLLMWWNDPSTSHLDELQFALDVFEERLAKGLQAKNTTIRIIVANGRLFREGSVPPEKKEIARVPRDRKSWVELLGRLRSESESLKNDVRFIDDFAMALVNLGCYAECTAFVQDALGRGIRPRQNTLRMSLHAAEASEMLEEATDIQLAIFRHDQK